MKKVCCTFSIFKRCLPRLNLTDQAPHNRRLPYTERPLPWPSQTRFSKVRLASADFILAGFIFKEPSLSLYYGRGTTITINKTEKGHKWTSFGPNLVYVPKQEKIFRCFQEQLRFSSGTNVEIPPGPMLVSYP